MAPNIGAVVTPLTIPLLAIWLGWQSTFLIAGALGLVWVVVWLAVRLPAQPGVSAAPRLSRCPGRRSSSSAGNGR
jgi:ACS family hexuronate transporter-like MFS transporter